MGKGSRRSSASLRLEALQDLSVEMIRTSNFDQLLRLIVTRSMELLKADAGSLFLKKDDKILTFHISVNKSLNDFVIEHRDISISANSIASYCFTTGQTLNIEDAYAVSEGEAYAFDKSFDEKQGYRTKSMLVLPLVDSKGYSLGVLEIINKKNIKTQAWPIGDERKIAKMPVFDENDVKLLASFASIASAGIENLTLKENIKNLFEGFVSASVEAIESRDPATRGHSERVTILTIELAKEVSRSTKEGLKDISFTEEQLSELRYAALLHDFGKIAISESVLQKNDKLTELQKLKIQNRIEYFKNNEENRLVWNYLKGLKDIGSPPDELELQRLKNKIKETSKRLDGYWEQIYRLSKPTALSKKGKDQVRELSQMTGLDAFGEEQPILEDDEIDNLLIERGSLTDMERKEIESHVTKSFLFLKSIRWTPGLRRIPEIAYVHHERLDGSGYPRQLIAKDLSPQARILMICDVYDALVANDRPYKPALSSDAALDILQAEVDRGCLDKVFFELFLEAKLYELPAFIKLSHKKAA